mgnify:CR=1 FL=1
MTEIIKTEHAPAAIGPYSQGVKAGGMVYTAGQIPLNPRTGEIAQGGICGQAQQCLENLQQVLAAAGSGLDRVVKTTVFIKNMSEFAQANEVYARYFSGSRLPARSCVEVSALPKGVLIEIEAIACAAAD